MLGGQFVALLVRPLILVAGLVSELVGCFNCSFLVVASVGFWLVG